ncbi:hypothetical protein ACSBR1_034271 [Camellia fascicularis]
MDQTRFSSETEANRPNRVNQKGKNIRVDDDDYISSDHEDGTDAESFESVEDEPGPHNINKTHAKLIDHQLHHSMNYLLEGFSKSRTVAGTGARCSLVHLTTSITSTSVFKLGLSNREFHGEWPLVVARFSKLPPVPSRHSRGLTRGLKVQAMVQKDGKVKVPIPQEYPLMIKIQVEHCSEPGVVPITPEELSVKVLKPGSGYVKGLGLGHSFSVRTTSASTNSDYVRRLEMEIQEQKEEIQSQKEEI